MIVDGWRLIVAWGPQHDTERQWQFWLARQAETPSPADVRVDRDVRPDIELNQYWVRGDLPLGEADRIVVVRGSFDPKNRKQNTVLGRCGEPAGIANLIDALATTTDDRPFLMMVPDPTIVFLSGRSNVIAEIGVKDGAWITSDLWSGDAPLQAPQALQAWLTATIEQ